MGFPKKFHDDIVDLVPLRTVLGLFVGSDDTSRSAVFQLLRQLPADARIAGRFHPADGYAAIDGPEPGSRLAVQGRHAQARGSLDGQTIREDATDHDATTRLKLAWQLEAERIAWVGNFVPAEG